MRSARFATVLFLALLVVSPAVLPLSSASLGASPAGAGEPPIPRFTIACAGLHCVFDPFNSTDADGDIKPVSNSFPTWKIGGTTWYGGPRRATVNFPAPGMVPVCLTQYDQAGHQATACRNVTIGSFPSPALHTEDFSDGTAQGFTLTGLWRVDNVCSRGSQTTPSLRFHHPGRCGWEVDNAGDATLAIDLRGSAEPLVSFRRSTAQDTDQDGDGDPTNDPCFEFNPCDIWTSEAQVVSTDGGNTWSAMQGGTTCESSPPYTRRCYLLPGGAGPSLLRWSFVGHDGESISAAHYLDDIVVYDRRFAPFAHAGPDRTAYAWSADGAPVTMDGGLSVDRDGPIASYSWSRNGSLLAMGPSPTLTLPMGDHAITLTVTDVDGFTAVDEVVLHVMPPPLPQADAGPDRTVVDADDDGTQAFTLDARASGGPSPLVAYEWSSDGVVIGTTPTVETSAPIGAHLYSLRVTDDVGRTSNDTVTITVAPNAPPTARAGPDQRVHDADGDGIVTVVLDGSTSTDDVDVVAYEWSEDGVLLGTSATHSLGAVVGNHTYTLRATDAAGASSSDVVLVDVWANRLPVAAAHPPNRFHASGNGTALVWADGRNSTDPDGPIVSYAWSIGGMPVATGRVTNFTLGVGTHDITLTVTDLAGATSSATTRTEVYPDALPVAHIGCCCLDLVCRFDATASVDADGPIVNLTWDFGDGSLGYGWAPVHAFATSGEYVVRLTARDDVGGEGTATRAIVVTASSHPAPARPPAEVTATDTTPDGTLAAPAYDVEQAWFESNATDLWVGLKVKDVPSTTGVPVQWAVFFQTNWPLDRSWGGRVPATSYTGLRIVAVRSPGFTPFYELQAMEGSPSATVPFFTTLGAVEGSADPATDILWWRIPRAMIQSPPPGASLDAVHMSAYAWSSGDFIQAPSVVADRSAIGSDAHYVLPCPIPTIPAQRAPIVNPPLP